MTKKVAYSYSFGLVSPAQARTLATGLGKHIESQAIWIENFKKAYKSSALLRISILLEKKFRSLGRG
jgi:hypothetical protein